MHKLPKFTLVDGGFLVGMNKLHGVFERHNVHGLRLIHSIYESGQSRRFSTSSGTVTKIRPFFS